MIIFWSIQKLFWYATHTNVLSLWIHCCLLRLLFQTAESWIRKLVGLESLHKCCQHGSDVQLYIDVFCLHIVVILINVWVMLSFHYDVTCWLYVTRHRSHIFVSTVRGPLPSRHICKITSQQFTSESLNTAVISVARCLVVHRH